MRGKRQFARENSDPVAWQRLMQGEKARGITYVVLAGAEPSLVPDLLEICSREMPLGCIASNGFKRISRFRGYKFMFPSGVTMKPVCASARQGICYSGRLKITGEDPRAVFVYTFTKSNIDEVREVVEKLADQGCKTTFNVFSAPIGMTGPCDMTANRFSGCGKSC